ncbi:MAG: helix-turn-helix domain-containing protein, partial [Woeseiaceae bacterium]
SALAARLQPQLLQLGIGVLIGVSSDVPSTSHIPRALEEATLALEFAGVANRVVQYADIPVRRMMLRLSRESLRAALPAWADALHTADKKMRGALNATLHAYAEANMNVLQAAKLLAVHPNTIYARFNKVQDVTGKNALVYNDLTELLLAMDCREV